MHKRTKALAISKKVKDSVWKRDGYCCVLCGTPYAMPNAHFIARAQGGLGIEENIVTLCSDCHRRYDQSPERACIREQLRTYLTGIYSDVKEENLTYRKWETC